MSLEREYRDLSFVPRWTIIRTIKQQSVAEHSFYVALYAEQLARLIEWNGDYTALMYYALIHDLDEILTGDIVGPAKNHFVDKDKYDQFVDKELNHRFKIRYAHGMPDNKGITEEIRTIIKIADGLDEVFYLAGERQMGNTSIDAVLSSRITLLREKFFNTMTSVFRRSNAEASFRWMIIEKAIADHQFQTSKVVA